MLGELLTSFFLTAVYLDFLADSQGCSAVTMVSGIAGTKDCVLLGDSRVI